MKMKQKMKKMYQKALRKKYEADIEEAKTTAEVYLQRPVGIGEHPQFIEELDKLISKLKNYLKCFTLIVYLSLSFEY